jgi:hypothetical protein
MSPYDSDHPWPGCYPVFFFAICTVLILAAHGAL